MRTLTLDQYLDLIRGAKVLAYDARHRQKVFRCANGTFIKLFRCKRVLSSAVVWPYVRRFRSAAASLRRRGVATVKVIETFRVRGMARHGVVYEGVDGTSLRKSLAAAGDDAGRRDALLTSLARFIADLHRRGVYFRAIHFNNVIVRDDDSMGLIDITDSWFTRGPLPVSLRARNFKPPFRYEFDRRAIASFGVERFVNHYLHHADLTERDSRRFLRTLAAQPHVPARVRRLVRRAGAMATST